MVKLKRRELLLGSIATAFVAAWSRVAGAAGILRPAPPPSAPLVLSAGETLGRMLRDRRRRLIEFEILRASNDGEIEPAEADRRMLSAHMEALRHPPPPREIPPLPPDQVNVDEAMALLRRAIYGQSHIELERPWREVFHSLGKFEIDGWEMLAFKRNRGIKYLDRAVAPDGRVGTYNSWSAREGNPVHHRTDDEQDKLDDLIEEIDT